MVSRVIALKALSRLTGIEDLNVFHKVLFINGSEVGNEPRPPMYTPEKAATALGKLTIKKNKNGDPEKKGDKYELDDDVKICYMVCSKSTVYLVEISRIAEKSYMDEMKAISDQAKADETMAKAYLDGKHSESVTLKEIEEKDLKQEAAPGDIPGLVCSFELTAITNIYTHSILADRFGLAIDKVYADKCDPAIPAFIALSSCHRKKIIEDLQISHDTAMISFNSQLAFLQPRPLAVQKPKGWPEFRHPTIMMFNTIPNPLKSHVKPFYRCGYLFLGPKQMEDTSMANLYNRHSCTYTFPAKDAGGGSLADHKSKHLVVRIMPEKPIRSSMPDSNLNFHLWVESIAWSVAKDEVLSNTPGKAFSSSSIFIPERGVYRKKMNITADESMYHCFRLHIFTRYREIGVIGVRRKYIPPLIDSFQDMVFVLKGAHKPTDWNNEPQFMESLERMVDTLSPSAMDWRIDSFWAEKLRQPPEESHPTYIDRFIIQEQANALLCNHDVYSWLRNRNKFKIVPTMQFNGKECYKLAEQFCRSTCKAAYDGKLKGSKKEQKGGRASEEDLILNSVNDPISIVKRFEASAQVMLEEQKISKQIKMKLLNNWKMRVSKYFAHVVDCLMPQRITIVKLASLSSTRVGVLSPANQTACDKVVAFLLYMHKRGGVYVQPENNVLDQLKDDDLMSRMECNEVVLLKLLSASYFENLNQTKETLHLTRLLANLLYRKSNNLDIVKAVCRKIRRNHEHDIHKLIEPLVIIAQMGNAYSQTYAFQALTTIARVGSSATEICKRKGVEIAMHVVYSSLNRELVQAGVSFLETVVSKRLGNHGNTYVKMMSKVYFLDKLKHLLSQQILGQRHDAPLLSAVARLIMHICTRDQRVLFYVVISGVIKELVAIIRDHSNYYRILIPISACLATIFFKLGDNKEAFAKLIAEPESVLNDALTSQAQVLVMTLKRMMNPEGLQVAMNILIVLKHMVNLVERKGDMTRKKALLKDLEKNYAFEHVLNRCNEVAARCEDMKRSTSEGDTEQKMWATIVAGVRTAAEDLRNHVDEVSREEEIETYRETKAAGLH
mmetsp:Transcript_659/g.1296  ORF Transcript_659/g.1296 Transcript_659/m.1296 type:complete len:1065 (-) Transcript_659:266-3460(-)